MRALVVSSFERECSFIPVKWRLDQCAWHGRIVVDVSGIERDAEIVAELCALRYLLVQRCVLGGGGDVAPPCEVTVSFDEIRRLCEQDAEKGHLVPYGRYLFFALNARSVEVSKHANWVDTPELRYDWLLVASPAERPTVEVKHIGPLKISRHVVERFIQRHLLPEHSKANGWPLHAPHDYRGKVSNALNSIRRMMNGKHTWRSSKAPSIYAMARHGKKAIELVHETSNCVFVVVDDCGKWVLSTVKKLQPGEAMALIERVSRRDQAPKV